jgi:hypothetical protein
VNAKLLLNMRNTADANDSSQAWARLDQDAIARRAYQLWEKAGCPTGRELEHWLRAEAELLTESSHSAPTKTTPEAGPNLETPTAPELEGPPQVVRLQNWKTAYILRGKYAEAGYSKLANSKAA